MTPEQLLQPRYIIIALWPFERNYEIGSIIPLTYDSFCDDYIYKYDPSLSKKMMDKYPHLFRPMPWYEGRSDEDLSCVKYVKRIGKYNNGDILTVADKKYDFRLWHVDNEIEFRFIKDADFIPVSESEYLTYINNKK